MYPVVRPGVEVVSAQRCEDPSPVTRDQRSARRGGPNVAEREGVLSEFDERISCRGESRYADAATDRRVQRDREPHGSAQRLTGLPLGPIDKGR